MRSFQRRLQQSETFFRLFDQDARLFVLVFVPFGQTFVIELEVVTEQRQAEAPLPLERPVTRSAVAAQAAEQRHDMLLEVRHFARVFAGEALAGRSDDGVVRERRRTERKGGGRQSHQPRLSGTRHFRVLRNQGITCLCRWFASRSVLTPASCVSRRSF